MYSKTISLGLFSLAVLVFGVAYFAVNFSTNMDILYTGAYKIFLYSTILGILGFIIGKILDYARFRR